MSESYYAGVYWPGRCESTEESARHAEKFFWLISRCDPIFSRWFEKADTLEDALRLQFEPTYETLLRLFGTKYQFDNDGVSFGAWTGHTEDGDGSALMLWSGSAAEVAPNSCLLDLPYAGSAAGRVLSPPVLAAVLRVMVLAWTPDFGLVTPDDLRAMLRPKEDRRQSLGWLTYLSAHRGTVPPLPEPVRVEPMDDTGSLVILTPERLRAGNPEHLALARRVQALLDEKNLLAPVISPRSPHS